MCVCVGVCSEVVCEVCVCVGERQAGGGRATRRESCVWCEQGDKVTCVCVCVCKARQQATRQVRR